MTKKILRWTMLPLVAAAAFIGFNSFTEPSESGSDTCTNHCQSATNITCRVTINGTSKDCPSMKAKP